MTRLEELLVELGSSLGAEAGASTSESGPESGVTVDRLQLDVPMEHRLGRGAELRATLPRGRLATGFAMPHGRMYAEFGWRAR